MTNAFANYLTTAKLSDADFAAVIGKDRSLVNKMRHGKARPTLDTAAEIEAKTGGAVPMQAWTDLAQVSMCGTCERRAEDPSITSCTRTDCGLRHREAA